MARGSSTPYNWLGENEQTISFNTQITAGSHVLSAEFQKTGDDPQTASATGTLALYLDTDEVAQGELMAQPAMFGLSGGGGSVGRGNGSSVSASYRGSFPFSDGVIERVIVDVSGEHYEVLASVARD
jgi:hypothetical protein